MSKRNSSLLYPCFVKEKEDPLLAEEKKPNNRHINSIKPISLLNGHAQCAPYKDHFYHENCSKIVSIFVMLPFIWPEHICISNTLVDLP